MYHIADIAPASFAKFGGERIGKDRTFSNGVRGPPTLASRFSWRRKVRPKREAPRIIWNVLFSA